MSTLEISKSDFQSYMKSKDRLLLANVNFFVDEKFRLVTKISYPGHYETHFPLFLHALDDKMKQFTSQLTPAVENDLQSIFFKMESEK